MRGGSELVIGLGPFIPTAPAYSTTATLRYSRAQRSRNQIVIVLLLVLALDCPISDDENEDDDEERRFARPATNWTDTAEYNSALRWDAKHIHKQM